MGQKLFLYQKLYHKGEKLKYIKCDKLNFFKDKEIESMGLWGITFDIIVIKCLWRSII